MINLETGQSKCFGFVRFSSLPEAHAAIQGLNGRLVGFKRLLVNYAESREKQKRASAMLYIKRLPVSVSQDVVIELFSRFGEVQSLTPHVLDRIDHQFWRCVIRYGNFSVAETALTAMNNQIIAPNTPPIHVGFADESRMSASFGQPPRLSLEIDDVDVRQLLPSFLLV
jgi:RNA recognition motif-containing protein